MKFRTYDKYLGRRLRNDPRGIGMRASEIAHLKFCQLNSPYKTKRSVREKINNGFLDIEYAYNSEKLKVIKEKIGQYFDDNRYAKLHEIDGYIARKSVTGDRINFQEISGFEHLMEKDKINEKIRNYFGANFVYSRTIALKYQHVPRGKVDREVATRKWHIDTLLPGNTIRLLIFLTDDSSPLQIVSSRQTLKLLDKYTLNELKNTPEIIEDNVEVQSFGGDRGDAILFNPRTQLHRAANPDKEECRTVLIFTIVPKLF